jgi:glycosyltransferase involved in cell wall biosynthesis
MRCARAFGSPRVRFVHIGDALDPTLGQQARDTAASCPNYRWLGGLSRAATRQWMRRAHLLLHPSKMEGGAQAIIEAITAGTPVIASDIDGNVGLLGAGYPGLFPVGDAAACVALLQRAADDPRFYRSLANACKKRAPLFDPRREEKSLVDVLARQIAASNRVMRHTRP